MMREKENKVPKRRFKKFETDDAWQKREFSDIFNLSQGLQIEISKRFVNPGDNMYFYITNEFLRSDSNERYYIYNPPVSVLCDESDILMTRTGNTGIVVTDVKGCFHNNFFKIKYESKNYDKHFICQYLSTPNKQKEILNSAGSSTIPDLSHKSFYKLLGNFPNIIEQKRISDFLIKLDNIITRHQSKLEKMKALKKAYLTDMFPAEGERKPKLRFAGFTDDWEMRKLGDVIDGLYNGQTPSRFRDDFWNGNINWLSSGELNRSVVRMTSEKITAAGQDNANLRIVPKNTFVMAITGLEAAGTRGNCGILGIDTTLNQSCMAVFPNKKMLSTQFLFQWYKVVGEDYGIRFTQGTKQQSYNAAIVKNLDICLPKVEEQSRISTFLSELDNLITLHQNKLDKLQNIKKAYVNEMFI